MCRQVSDARLKSLHHVGEGFLFFCFFGGSLLLCNFTRNVRIVDEAVSRRDGPARPLDTRRIGQKLVGFYALRRQTQRRSIEDMQVCRHFIPTRQRAAAQDLLIKFIQKNSNELKEKNVNVCFFPRGQWSSAKTQAPRLIRPPR